MWSKCQRHFIQHPSFYSPNFCVTILLLLNFRGYCKVSSFNFWTTVWACFVFSRRRSSRNKRKSGSINCRKLAYFSCEFVILNCHYTSCWCWRQNKYYTIARDAETNNSLPCQRACYGVLPEVFLWLSAVMHSKSCETWTYFFWILETWTYNRETDALIWHHPDRQLLLFSSTVK